MIVVDASVLIAHLEQTDPLHERATDLLARCAPQGLGASTISLAEVLVGPARAGKLALGEGLLETLSVLEVPLAAGAASELAGLRASTGRRLPDCAVLYAARSAQAALATLDKALAASARELGLVVMD